MGPIALVLQEIFFWLYVLFDQGFEQWTQGLPWHKINQNLSFSYTVNVTKKKVWFTTYPAQYDQSILWSHICIFVSLGKTFMLNDQMKNSNKCCEIVGVQHYAQIWLFHDRFGPIVKPVSRYSIPCSSIICTLACCEYT